IPPTSWFCSTYSRTAVILIVGKLLGLGGDGFGLAGSIVTFPLLACTSALFCWLPLWLLHKYRVGPMPTSRALLLGLTVGLLMAFIVAGPNGFMLSGGAPLFNYFLIMLTTAGGVVHNWALSRDTA
ncbi:MAG: hypothetical protein WD733_23525, partial [Bryobacterales bacterium]